MSRNTLFLARRFSTGILWSAVMSMGALMLLGGLLIGFSLSRAKPKFVTLRIENTTFHAGEGIKIRRNAKMPVDCSPKMTRWVHFYGDPTKDLTPFDYVLTDAPGPPSGNLEIPTSQRMPTGMGAYFESMSAQGCGWLSGVFPPLSDTALAVPVMVLPAIPIK